MRPHNQPTTFRCAAVSVPLVKAVEVSDPRARDRFAEAAVQHGWSKDVLRDRILDCTRPAPQR